MRHGSREKNPTGRGEEEEEAEDDPLLVAVTKLTLQNKQESRQFASSLWDTFLGNNSVSPIVASQKAGKQYAAAVKDQGKQHKLGSPHIHIIMAFFEALAKEEAASQLLKLTAAKMDQDGPDFIQQLFPYFRVTPTYKPEICKIQFMMHPLAVWKLDTETSDNTVLTGKIRAELHDYLKAVGFVRKDGAAPKGELERVVQRLLNRRIRG